MYILNRVTNTLCNLREEPYLYVGDQVIYRYTNGSAIYRGVDATKRFYDIADALAADVKVYDCSADLGSWKKKKTVGRPKAEPKVESK